MPHNFIYKIVRTKHFIEETSKMVHFVPITMNIYTTLL